MKQGLFQSAETSGANNSFNPIDEKEYAKTIKIQWNEFDKSAWQGTVGNNYRKSKSKYFQQRVGNTDFEIRLSNHNKAIKGSGLFDDSTYEILEFNGVPVKINEDFVNGYSLDADIVLNKMTDFKKIKTELTQYIKDKIAETYIKDCKNNPKLYKLFDNDNPNIYFQKSNDTKVTPIKIEKDSVPNFEKVSDLKKWIENNLNLLGDVQIKSNNRTVHFSKSNIGRSMKGVNRNSTKRDSYAELKELVENSVYGYTKEVDERHSKRNNGQEIYHNAFIYNGEVYGIEISIDIPKNTNTTHSYAGHKIKIIKKAPEVNGTKLPDLTGANISINDIRALFNPNVNNHEDNQSNKESIEKTVQDKFGCSVDELTENIKQDVINALADNNISDSEFNIQDIRLYGSYSKGTNKQSSDLDFIVQYDGSMKEDSAFNILHDVINTIEDKNGNKVTVDINPINVNESGTIDEHVAYMNSLDNNDNVYYQSAYHGTPHKFDEFSTEHIGSGEGAQAHGWGLYFAGNKDVSEGYRKNLSQSLNNASYDGIPLYKTELSKLHSAISEKLYLKGKVEALKELNRLKEQSEKNKDKDGFLGRSSREFLEKYNEQLELLNSVDESKITGVNKGQLFEVDIPEDDVLLDEDLPLSEQPQKVQEALKTIAEKTEYRFFIEDWINRNLTGQEIYNELAMHMNIDNRMAYYPEERFNPFEKASKLFNEYGIKGIKYNGQQDGECYVIFDDKAVQVLKTYYQSMLSGIDKDQKVNVLDLTSAFGSDANLSKKDLTNYIKSLIGSSPISTSDKKAIVNFIARSKRVGKKDVLIPSHVANSSKVETKNKGVRNTVVNNIIDLIKNSVLIDKSENRDKQTKPNVDYYYRCYVPVRVNNDIYTVRITLENNEKDNLFNIVNGNVYDVIIDKKMAYSTSPDIIQGNLGKPSSNSNIPQNNKNVTSDQITIEDMLKDVLDAEGNSYFQNNEDSETKQKLSIENIEQKKNDLENKLTELTWSDSNEDNSSMIESISQDIETLERFLEKGVAELCKKYNIKITPDTVMTHYEFGKKHPKTSSAGKIDIVYLPPYPKVKKDEVGDFIRNKVTWYFNRL